MEALKIVYYGLLLTSLASLLFNINRLPAYCRWFLPLISLALLVQVASELMEVQRINSYILFHLYQPLECLLLLAFYRQILSLRTKTLPVIAFAAYLLVLGIHYRRSPASLTTWDFYDFAAEAFLVCFFVIIFFLQLLKNEEKTDLKHFPALWLNAAHLIFYGGCLFVMGLHFYVKSNDARLAGRILGINHFLNLFLYAAYTIVFTCTGTPKRYFLL